MIPACQKFDRRQSAELSLIQLNLSLLTLSTPCTEVFPVQNTSNDEVIYRFVPAGAFFVVFGVLSLNEWRKTRNMDVNTEKLYSYTVGKWQNKVSKQVQMWLIFLFGNALQLWLILENKKSIC